MPDGIFEQMMSRYEAEAEHDLGVQVHAGTGAGASAAGNNTVIVREVMQQVALAGLHRAGFFEHAAFYGGTMLRIFHGLDRFSEDMDFSLLAPDSKFDFGRYTSRLKDEFSLIGREVEVVPKSKTGDSAILSAFLKDDTRVYDIQGNLKPAIKIKLEIDTCPPVGFSTEYRLSLLPYSFMTRVYSLSSAFAGKMHALLFRGWKTRVKGRDWYDFEWYVRNGVPLDLAHFNARALQTGHITSSVDAEGFLVLLRDRIDSVSYKQAKEDLSPFIREYSVLDIWSAEYFKQLAAMMQFRVDC
jgi:predicted nucleotidyltransferase component of viral defense system